MASQFYDDLSKLTATFRRGTLAAGRSDETAYRDYQRARRLVASHGENRALGSRYDICSPFPEAESTISGPLLWRRILALSLSARRSDMSC